MLIYCLSNYTGYLINISNKSGGVQAFDLSNWFPIDMIVNVLKEENEEEILIANSLRCLANFIETGIQVVNGRRQFNPVH